MTRHRPLITGLSAGALALGLNYLVHALFPIPLLPEQAGYLLIRVLPLAAFDNLLKTFGILARPLLLVGATIVIVAAYGLAALVLVRLQRQRSGSRDLPGSPSQARDFPPGSVPILTGLVAVVSAIVAVVAFAPGDSIPSLLAEVVLLAVPVPLVDAGFRTILSPSPANEERRVLLRNLLWGGVGIAVLGIGYVNVRRFGTALAMREGNRAPSEVTDIADFYVVSKNLGGDPVVDGATWRLVLPSRSLTYAQLLALPSHRVELTLECISNDVGGTLISNGVWQGPRVSDVLALTTVPSDAVWLLFESADGYTESFPLSELTPDHVLATHMNGGQLPTQHGFPARFIFPGHYGMKQPKWVTRIHFSASDQPGYWENNGWDERAIVKTMSRIDRPSDGAALSGGSVAFGGIAFAGARRISAVELSWDGRRTWHPAVLEAEFSAYAWRFWQLTTNLAAGHYNVSVRAIDGSGAVQTSQPAPTLPNGADGYHTIALDVA